MVATLVRGLFWYLNEPTRLLIRRDIVSFIRDPVQWSQVLIFFGLLAIYFFNLQRFYYQITRDFWRVLVSLLNLGATCLTLATFTSRFVYPQVSLEAQRMWVVGLAPITRRGLLLAKFVAAVAGSVLLAGGLVALSNWMLEMPTAVAVVQLLVAVLVATGLSGLAVGLGANVALNAALIPAFGALGAAWTTVVTQTLTAGLLWMHSRAVLRRRSASASVRGESDAKS